MPKLPVAQRDEYGRRAYQMSVRGLTAPEIARALGVSDTTVDALLKRERKRVWDEIGAEEQREVIAQFEGEQRAAMAKSWATAEKPGTSAHMIAANMANFIAASVNIAKAKGAFVGKEGEQQNATLTVIHQLDEMWRRPLPPKVIDGESRILSDGT